MISCPHHFSLLHTNREPSPTPGEQAPQECVGPASASCCAPGCHTAGKKTAPFSPKPPPTAAHIPSSLRGPNQVQKLQFSAHLQPVAKRNTLLKASALQGTGAPCVPPPLLPVHPVKGWLAQQQPREGPGERPAQHKSVRFKPPLLPKEIWLVLAFIFRPDTRTAEL